MFYNFTNETWTASSGAVVITTNTDNSLDGSSRKIVWTTGINQYVTIAFTSVNLSGYEEISLQIDKKRLMSTGAQFRITVDGVNYDFEDSDFNLGWNHILIDCSEMGAVASIVITSLVQDLTMFVDVLGYRNVTHNRDIDLLEAVQDTLSLTYGVTTTLSAAVTPATTRLPLTSNAYIHNTSVITIDNGAGTVETVYLEDKNGTVKGALTNTFAAGALVTVTCPILIEDYMDVEPDPVCGVTIYTKETKNDVYTEWFALGSAKKVYTGALGVCIYIDCSSKLKLLQLAREYDYKYGESFRVLLDGEVFTMFLSYSEFIDRIVGNNPRFSYYYKVEAQGFRIFKTVPTTVTLTMSVEPISEAITMSGLTNMTDVVG